MSNHAQRAISVKRYSTLMHAYASNIDNPLAQLPAAGKDRPETHQLPSRSKPIRVQHCWQPPRWRPSMKRPPVRARKRSMPGEPTACWRTSLSAVKPRFISKTPQNRRLGRDPRVSHREENPAQPAYHQL